MQVHLMIQEEARQQRRRSFICDEQTNVDPPIIHFIETTPSVLREMPWVNLKEHKVLIFIVIS